MDIYGQRVTVSYGDIEGVSSNNPRGKRTVSYYVGEQEVRAKEMRLLGAV